MIGPAGRPEAPVETSSPLEEEIDLRALVRVLVRRRLIAIGIFVAAILIGALINIRAPRIYKAVATVHIDQNAPEVLGGNVREVVGMGSDGYWGMQAYYQTQYSILRSRPVAEKAAFALGLSAQGLIQEIRTSGAPSLEARAANDALIDLPAAVQDKLRLLGFTKASDRDQLLEALEKADPAEIIQGQVKVEPVKDSRLVNVSVEGTDPAVAARIANAVVNAFIEFNLDRKVVATRSAVDWLSDQTHELREKLKESELALHEFKKANNIVSVSMEARQTMIAETLSQLNSKLSETRAKRIEMESRREQLRRAKDDQALGESLEVLQNKLVQDLKAAQSRLEQEVADLETRYTNEHPRVRAARNRLELARRDLDAEIGKIQRNTEDEYAAISDTERRLGEEIERVKSEALELNKQEIEYSRLKRERDNNESLYSLVLKRQKETDLTQLLKVNNVSKLEAATVPDKPVRPRVMLNMLLALVLGVLGGVGGAFLVDYLDNTVKTQSQIEQVLGLPFLGIIPAIKDDKGARLVETPARDNYIIAHPRSSVAECCRTIRTNLLFMAAGRDARCLLVTSSGPQEGKSTSAINLAVTMAQSGMRTVLVDTDMRRPRLHKSFKVDNERGVSNLILGEGSLGDTVKPSGVARLDLLTCGPIPPNPAELLHTDGFGDLVRELTARYDRVIFDSPPVGAVADPLVLASMVDGVILVVHGGRTSWQAALQAKRRLADVGGNIFGVILNNVDLDDRHGGDYYQYYYYYRSGYGEDAGKERGGEGRKVLSG